MKHELKNFRYQSDDRWLRETKSKRMFICGFVLAELFDVDETKPMTVIVRDTPTKFTQKMKLDWDYDLFFPEREIDPEDLEILYGDSREWVKAKLKQDKTYYVEIHQ